MSVVVAGEEGEAFEKYYSKRGYCNDRKEVNREKELADKAERKEIRAEEWGLVRTEGGGEEGLTGERGGVRVASKGGEMAGEGMALDASFVRSGGSLSEKYRNRLSGFRTCFVWSDSKIEEISEPIGFNDIGEMVYGRCRRAEKCPLTHLL
jgi:hypothetical protein